MGAPKNNKNAIGNQGGRPPFFKTKEELQTAIDNYFESEANKRTIHLKDGSSYDIPIYTICGLALHLGFSTRQSLLDYAEKIEFVDVIKNAKTRIEMTYEEGLHFGECAGKIFALKNMGWKDKIENNCNIITEPKVIFK